MNKAWTIYFLFDETELGLVEDEIFKKRQQDNVSDCYYCNFIRSRQPEKSGVYYDLLYGYFLRTATYIFTSKCIETPVNNLLNYFIFKIFDCYLLY